MKKNIVSLTDSYKFTHHKMYPKNTQVVYSYWEARTGAKWPETVFFGLQYYMKEYLEGCVVTREGIEQAAALAKAHFGSDKVFNREMWEYILEKNGGKLPIRIKAVPEGTVVSVNNVMLTIENLETDPICAPLVNHLETLLCQMWAPSTCATLSRAAKKLCKTYLDQTSDNPGAVNFMLHDFGMRGVSSMESAGIEGAGHLLNFMGTDTVIAMETANQYYNAPYEGLAYSVPASEHSVMTALGRQGETDVVGQILDAYPTGILAMVGDSFDIYHFAENILGGKYRDRILERDGKVVCRPDSGDPVEVSLKVLKILGDMFDYTTNTKGYKVLNPKIGMLWGDGIGIVGMEDILSAMEEAGWSAENIVFGMGGGLLQKINRDTQRFAFKSSAQMRDGVWYDVYKDPIEGKKSSKRGRLVLFKNAITNQFETHKMQGDVQEGMLNQLQTVFENGKIVKEYTFAEARENAKL